MIALRTSVLILRPIEHGIIGKGSQILTNQKRENSAFSILIGRNLRHSINNYDAAKKKDSEVPRVCQHEQIIT